MVLNFGLGFFVFFKNRKNKANFYFSFLILSILVWSISIVIYRKTNNNTSAILWAKILYASASCIPSIFLFFIHFFIKKNGFLTVFKKFIIIAFNIIIFLLIIFDGYVIADVFIPNYGEKIIRFGPWYFAFVIYVPVLFFIAYYRLYRSFKEETGLLRIQIKYVFIGTLLATILTVNSNLLLPTFGNFDFNWFGQVSIIIMIAFITYAILRYRLMDVRLIIIRSITFGIIFFFVTAIFSVISTIFTEIFANRTGFNPNILTAVVLSILVSFFYNILRKAIENVTNTFLYKKTYHPEKLIEKVTRVVASIVDRNQLFSSLTKILLEAFHCEKISVILVNKTKNKLAVAFQSGFNDKVLNGLVNFPNIIVTMLKRFELTPGIQVIDELKARYESGDIQLVDAKLTYALYENDVAVVVPLYVQDRLIGVLVLGNKKSGDSYTSGDLHVLNIIAGQAAVAIENSTLYEEQKKFAITLKQEIEKATIDLREANQRLEELLQQKSEFLSIASHQLRTPTSIAKGMLSMVVDGTVKGAQKEDFIAKSFLGVIRLERIIRDLLSASELEGEKLTLECAPNDIETIIGDVILERKQLAEQKGLKLEFKKAKEKFPLVMIDKIKILEVIANLLDNAIHYTEKGSITIWCEENKKNMVEVHFKDTGMGIAKEDWKKLFQKFSRGDRSPLINPNGSGLGLFIVKKIVESCNGTIETKSEGAGKGSEFIVSLHIAP